MSSNGRQRESAPDAAETFTSKPRWRRWIILAGFVGLVAFHAPLLRAAYGLLVVDESLQDCESAVLLTGTMECYDQVAKLLRDGTVSEILIVDFETRAVRVGAANSFSDLARREMKKRDIPDVSVRIITSTAATAHEHVRQLDQHMSKTPQTTCVVVAPTTLSRYYRHVIDAALPAGRAAQYRLHAVQPIDPNGPKGPDALNAWYSRSGIKRVVHHGMRLAFVMVHGESHVDPHDPYEHLLSESRAD